MTTAPVTHGPDDETRYSPADFHRLTNRVAPSRPSSPHFTPDSCSGRAHEPPGASISTAECPNERETFWSDMDATTRRGLESPSQRELPSTLTAGASTDPASSIPDRRVFSRSSSTSSGSSSTSQGVNPCVIEETRGVAQSFLETVNAAIAPNHDTSPTNLKALASPASSAETCECCCRCGRSPKWRPLATRKRRSKSYTALRTDISELFGWDSELPVPQELHHVDPTPTTYGPGNAPLERLPVEILDDIIAQLALDLPPQDYAPRNVDLINCLLTSKTIHVATINTLYKHVTVPHSSIFSKFLNHIDQHPGLGTLVRRLDLSHFTSVGLGRSRQSNSEIQNLTPKTLARCLELTPAVQEVLLQENLDDDVDANVIEKLFFQLPQLRAVDFCASSSLSFVGAFRTVLDQLPRTPERGLSIQRLSLHECFTLPSHAFDRLLPHLPKLTHLDVAHTRITDRALASIPQTARLSHLNLGRCMHVSGEGVVDVLLSHPAMRNLVYLNLSCDITRYRLLWEPDVDRLLPALPSTLRSLNLNGAHIHQHHISHLIPLTRHLEELGISHAELTLADVNALFRPDPSPTSSNRKNATVRPDIYQDLAPPTLHYLDLSCIPTITQATLFNTPAPTNVLLSSATLPLEVIELGDKAISSLRECKNTNKRLGWCIKELGRRGWYVRDLSAAIPAQSSYTSGSGSGSGSSSPALSRRGSNNSSASSDASSASGRTSPASSRSSASSPSSSKSASPTRRAATMPLVTSSTTATVTTTASAAISPPYSASTNVISASGRRSWKMGAMWWGMRKCPVAWGDVGGLYGHYMFKK